MKSTVGPGGQVVVPLELLEQCGLAPGDEVSLWREGDHIVLGPAPSDEPVRGRFASRPLTALLEEERATERSRGGLP